MVVLVDSLHLVSANDGGWAVRSVPGERSVVCHHPMQIWQRRPGRAPVAPTRGLPRQQRTVKKGLETACTAASMSAGCPRGNRRPGEGSPVADSCASGK